MDVRRRFGQCLQQALAEQGLSASEAARLVGFRSRNSIFRILNGETSADVDGRFLNRLRSELGDSWPHAQWKELEAALEMKRVGLKQHLANQAFFHGLFTRAETVPYVVETQTGARERPLGELLQELCSQGQIRVTVCGCCERSLMELLAERLSGAGASGRLEIRHYMDAAGGAAVHSLMGVLPVLGKVWYNAYLVGEGECPDEMTALYRLNMICLSRDLPDGRHETHRLLKCDRDRFVHTCVAGTEEALMKVLGRCGLQLLKPPPPECCIEAVRQQAARYAALEKDCMLLSIKPDIHFSLVPVHLLGDAMSEGFERVGFLTGENRHALLKELEEIHRSRVQNMYGRHRPVHLVYSLQAMERFMRTGVQSDHFYLQRAYTVEERREILRGILSQMRDNPFFNVWLMKEELPELRMLLTCFEGKGVLVMDAYTSYDTQDEHSEALIPLGNFADSFQRFFMDVLLPRLVMPRAEGIARLERFLT